MIRTLNIRTHLDRFKVSLKQDTARLRLAALSNNVGQYINQRGERHVYDSQNERSHNRSLSR